MRGLPDPEMRNRPAGHGTAYRKNRIEPHQLSEAASDLQAEKLRQLYSFCKATAAELALIVWGVGPR